VTGTDDLIEAACGDVNAVEALLGRGWGHLAVVQALLGRGADPNLGEAGGSTALVWAAREDYKEVVAALLAAGATH